MVAQLETPGINSTLSLPYSVQGLVQVFTSSHRTFLTSVMSQALRIAGQGTPVLIVQFLKGGIRQGKDNPIHIGKNLDWIRCDLPRCIDTPHLDETETQALQHLWSYTQQVVSEGKYSLVVLDELSLAINFDLIPEAEVLEFLTKRPPHVDIILSGPEMPKSLLDVADQITEIRRSHQL
ncbi:P-loop NTPase family protein [Sphaerospermopsis aphanizomenoides BCCUSP55]|uniref:P-loop NTPase family protein n=1 Tax=Sphaerospermopsis aphanizomenoides TaxID=459663 RepID=UPI001904A98D|nr:P-loop NTPase family protein [Sphaerospermopsis aphanizomenoides]MBK1986863.1 P-loop NTPase family protein [Sphaerospermopsis aphanizomenoides BCCUSP55]